MTITPISISTIKSYLKVAVLLLTIVGSLFAGATWVGRVESHVEKGDVKIEEFNKSQIDAAKTREKLDNIEKSLNEIKQDVKEIKENTRLNRKK